jgi:hypothetical protein
MTLRPAVMGIAALALALAAALSAQGPLAFNHPVDHPAIAYTTAQMFDAVSLLNERLAGGTAHLAFDRDSGYLPAVLDALQVPRASQIAVFSPTSFQADKIDANNPRAIFFNDSVAVGWVRGGLLEVAALDPQRGPVFYALDQQPAARPRFTRSGECLVCHRSWETLAVPGLFVLSTFPPLTKNGYASGGVTDQRTPFGDRWAGWYVTGRAGANRHMGNKLVPQRGDTTPAVTLDSLQGRFDLTGYPTPYSDIVALLVFEHQSRMTNLLTYLNWETRVADVDRHPNGTLEEAVHELVDYLLFVDETPLAGKIVGSSGFAAQFAAEGPRDAHGRSLRELDLETRLMRYPCSYMIYSPAFDALPQTARDAVYRRLWQVLSGADTARTYAGLSPASRRAIVEILRDTKKDLPAYFQPVRG